MRKTRFTGETTVVRVPRGDPPRRSLTPREQRAVEGVEIPPPPRTPSHLSLRTPQGRGWSSLILSLAALVSALGVPAIVQQCQAGDDAQRRDLEELRRRVETLESKDRDRNVEDARHEARHIRERQEMLSEVQGVYERVRQD